MKLYCNIPISTPNAFARIAAELTGQQIEVVEVTEEFRKSKEYKDMTITDKFPLLKTDKGVLHESSAIAKYFCALAGGKYLGTGPVERAQVDQWIAFANTTLVAPIMTVLNGIFGWAEVTQGDWNEASKNLKAHVKTLNTHLEGKKWLVGNSMTIADVYVGMVLLYPFQTNLDGGFRKAMKNITTWAESVYAIPEFVKILGTVQLCAKALKPVVAAEKKKEEKKAAPAPAPKKVEKAEKPKDNVESLPPTPFNLYDFKTLFVNHPDKGGKGVDTWYEMLDWEGWSFWHFHYDKYEGEGEKLHVTNNLMNGFLSRAEHTSKYTFARHGVFGEEPNLEIKGVWLLRGTVIPDGLQKEHPQFEYYHTRKLDPRNNKDDDKIVREYMGGKEGDTMEGLLCQTFRWHK